MNPYSVQTRDPRVLARQLELLRRENEALKAENRQMRARADLLQEQLRGSLKLAAWGGPRRVVVGARHEK